MTEAAPASSVTSLRLFIEGQLDELQVEEPSGSTLGAHTGVFCLAALARCCSLLDGMRLVQAERADLTGIFARQHFEAWLVGMYVLLKGPPAMAETISDKVSWFRKMAARIGVAEPQHHVTWGHAKGLRYDLIAEDVGRRLTDAGDPNGAAVVPAYDRVFRGQSLYSLHSGFAAIERYGDWQERKVVRKPGAKFPGEERFAALCTGRLARLVFRKGGLAEDRLDHLDNLTKAATVEEGSARE